MGGGAGGGGGGNAGAPVRYSQQPQQPYGSHPSSRRGSEVDQSYAYQAGAHYDDDSHSVASRGSRQSYDGDDYGRMDPETRIAHIKAQKEKERQRENAEKEMQVSSFLFYLLPILQLEKCPQIVLLNACSKIPL